MHIGQEEGVTGKAPVSGDKGFQSGGLNETAVKEELSHDWRET